MHGPWWVRELSSNVRHAEGLGPQGPEYATRRCLEALPVPLAIGPQYWTFLLLPSHCLSLRGGNINRTSAGRAKETPRPSDSLLPGRVHLSMRQCVCVCVCVPMSHVPVCVHFHWYLRLCAPTSECEQTRPPSGSEWGFLWSPRHSLLSRLLPGVGTWLILRPLWPGLLQEAYHPGPRHTGTQTARALRCLQGNLRD